MRFDRMVLRRSAQEVDPISWLTGSMVPLAFAALNLAYGLAFTMAMWHVSDVPALQLVAVAMCTGACLIIQALTRPMRPPLTWVSALGPIALAGGGMLISAAGYVGTELSIEVWWAPFGLALAIGSLAPYLPARAIAVIGTSAALVTVPIASVAVAGHEHWGPISTVLIVASPIISGIVATATFSAAVVSRVVPLIEKRSQSILTLDAPRSAEAEAAERQRLANLTARAVPFLEAIVESGSVRPGDRTLAGHLARRLRDDLVTASGRTWLDSVADERIVVVDPERRADRMRAGQRTALRALLAAILDLPGADAASLLVELRGAPDGSTAVGVSLDAELPEGRRQMHLAPYYLALRGSVDDLRIADDRSVRLSFKLPNEQ